MIIIWYPLSSQRSHLIGQLVLLLMTMLCLKHWLLKYVLRAPVGRSVKTRNNCRDTMNSLKHQWIVIHSIIGNKVNNLLTMSKFLFWIWLHGYHFPIIIKLVTVIFHPRNLTQQAPLKLWLAPFLLQHQNRLTCIYQIYSSRDCIQSGCICALMAARKLP